MRLSPMGQKHTPDTHLLQIYSCPPAGNVVGPGAVDEGDVGEAGRSDHIDCAALVLIPQAVGEGDALQHNLASDAAWPRPVLTNGRSEGVHVGEPRASPKAVGESDALQHNRACDAAWGLFTGKGKSKGKGESTGNVEGGMP